MKQNRILVFCPWAHSNSYYTAQFCNAVVSDQNKIFLVAPDNFLKDLLSEKVEQVNWPYLSPDRTGIRSVLQTPGQLIRFVDVIKTIRPVWIHLLWKHHLPVLLKYYLKRFKIGFTVHDPVLHSGESGVIRSWVQKQHVKMSTLCFVHGDNNRKMLLKNFDIDSSKLYKIPHGSAFFWHKKSTVSQEKNILFFGRIRKYKGLEVLLNSFRKAAEFLPGYRLVIRGQGDPSYVSRIIESLPDVDFENRYVDHWEVPDIFARAGFVVLPYLDGTQSGIVPMAFAFGRTCIVSAVGDIPEIVRHGENGLLVQPGNVDELVGALIRLANDDNLRNRLEQGALRTSKRINDEFHETLSNIVTDAYYSH